MVFSATTDKKIFCSGVAIDYIFAYLCHVKDVNNEILQI